MSTNYLKYFRKTPLEFSVIVATCIICTLIAGTGIWQNQQSKSLQILSQRKEASTLAKGLAQHAFDEILAADHILVAARENIERQGVTLLSPSPVIEVMTNDKNRSITLKEVFIYGPDGQLIGRNLLNNLERNNISKFGYFNYHRINSERGLKIGVPTHSQSDGKWVVTLSRRIDLTDGRFAGLVVATISIDALERLYMSFGIETHEIIALVSADGIILARHPSDISLIGADVSGGSFFRSINSQSPSGDCDYTSTIDGTNRFGSYQRLGNLPLVIVVAFDIKEALTSWNSYYWRNIIASLVGMIIVTIFGFFMARQLKQRVQIEEFLRLVASHSPEAVMCVGKDGKCLYATPAFDILTHCSPKKNSKQQWSHFVHPDDRVIVEDAIRSLPYGNGQQTIKYRYVCSRDLPVYVEASISLLPMHKNAFSGFIIKVRDIKESNVATQSFLLSKYNTNSFHTTLPGLDDLPDRNRFDEMLNQEWARAARTSYPISLLLIQVDCAQHDKADHGFERKNLCLQAVALAIRRSALRPGDFAGRYGKDEFAIILTDTERNGASVVATRILVAIEALGKNYFNDIDDFRSTVTIGFSSTYPSHKDPKTSSAALSVAVDVATYEAKISGSNQVVIKRNHAVFKKENSSIVSQNTQTHNDILA